MTTPFGGVSEAAALFALTFLSEDAAVLSAAVMVASGMLPLGLGFASCFLGIWLGDLWLYGMARAFGAPFVARFSVAPGVQRSRAWFEERGSLVLIVSRFVPGLRLPSYLAAGAMRFPLRTFIFVTGVVAAVWVAVIFAGSHFLGVARVPFIREHAMWLAVGAVAVTGTSIVVKPWLRKLAADRESLITRRWKARLARWTRWEFWPAWLFYAPVAVFYLWLAIRHRGFTLPTAANPGIPMGGLVGESKFATLDPLQNACPGAVAQTWLIAPGSPGDRFDELHIIVESHAVTLPFILKPDIGQRGVGVKLIRSLPAAREYLAAVDVPVLLQRYAPGPREAGIFYYRLPGEAAGRIFAITEKLFPVVMGDGGRSLEELILADPRAAIVAETYLRRFSAQRSRVLARGEILKLVEAGNHAQGCIFRDGMHLATPPLLAAIDRVSQSLPGFFIGRYDLRYAADDELRGGRGFSLVELNGASAEATSIYDARNSLCAAYRTLYRQWALVFKIGALNRTRGAQPASLRSIWREWRRTNAAIRTYPPAD
ncbi:MAG: VTT domain-containing protein [Chthoniobacter sp.]|uniref:DedA family protein n=1 Tax=Chthoniobacter sp. TaxID=2510640 RepID=UPI0032A86ABC